jgi:hypothetical protein
VALKSETHPHPTAQWQELFAAEALEQALITSQHDGEQQM